MNYKFIINDIIFPDPVKGWMGNVKFRLDAKSDNKLVWLDPDTNSIKTRYYDVHAKWYSSNLTFFVITGAALDARCTNAHLDMTFTIQQQKL